MSIDGKASVDGIWKALGELLPFSGTAVAESDQDLRYDATDGKRYKQDEAFAIHPLYHCGLVVLKLSQVIACKGSPEVGLPHRTRHPTTTLRVRSIKMELQRGSVREASSPSGMQRAPCCGSTENVRFQYRPCDNLDLFPSL